MGLAESEPSPWHSLLCEVCSSDTSQCLWGCAGSRLTVSTLVWGMRDGSFGKFNLSFLLWRVHSPFPSQNNMPSILPGKPEKHSQPVLFYLFFKLP